MTARISRRSLVSVGSAGLLFSTHPAAAARGATEPKGRRRAYVVVIDGCRPEEIDADHTPTLAALRAGGTHFPVAASLPVMETIPNHVMMMTGVRPDRSGVPANKIFDRRLGESRTMDRARDIKIQTVIERLNGSGFTTGTVLSKKYLYGVFGNRATHRWEPGPIVPASGHAPDAATMEAALAMVEEFDPNMMLVNLGDIDRVGHADYTGTDARAARQLALADTDAQVSRFVDLLKSSGRWSRSVLIVLADHSMDWSRPGAVVSLTRALEADPLLAGHVAVADNGGADLLYWLGSPTRRDEAVRRMRQIALATQGVLAVHEPHQPGLRLGPEAGDLVVYCKSGWRFTEPNPTGNPIPGNHGHPATTPIPFFISGGHRVVPRGSTTSRRVGPVDVAPTVGGFLGVGGPRGGYDGRDLLT